MDYFRGSRLESRHAGQGASRRAGWPLRKRCNAAMGACSPNPAGSPGKRPSTLLRLLAALWLTKPLRRVAAPSIRPLAGAARPLK